MRVSRVFKIGGSKAVILPDEITEGLKLKAGDRVLWQTQKGSAIMGKLDNIVVVCETKKEDEKNVIN